MDQHHRDIGKLRVKTVGKIVIPEIKKEYKTEVKCHITEEFITKWVQKAINAKFNEFDSKVSVLDTIGESIQGALKEIKEASFLQLLHLAHEKGLLPVLLREAGLPYAVREQ